MKKLNHSIIKNNNVYFKYKIEYEINAGLILKGWEVKSIFYKKVNINNCYISIINGEVFLIGSNFSPINNNENKIKNMHLNRNIKLLLQKKEINNLYGKIKLNNFTLVPIYIFWSENLYAKIKIGLAKGKTKIDKRLKIKEKDWNIKKSRLFLSKNNIY